jgi:hypothetical protein
LARDISDESHTLTQSGEIMGTPAYLSPEQIVADRDKIDRRTDIYSLGVTLFECLTLQRPYEAPSWDQLFQKIRHGVPPNPRRLNPRIPQDLRTVIEVAIDRDQHRRYPTAEAFAEDLRRVRAFEPIQAKAASVITRVGKWTRRNPAPTVAIGAVLLFGFAAALVVVGQSIASRRATREHLANARTSLAAGNFTAALEAVAQARERDPDSTETLELRTLIEKQRSLADQEERKKADAAAAAAARDEARKKLEQHQQGRAAIVELQSTLQKEKALVLSAYADDAARGALAGKERRLELLSVESERQVQESHEALERAARLETPWGGPSPETEAAFASFFLARWKDPIVARDVAQVAWLRTAVESHDREGRLQKDLLGRGSLTVAVEPEGAELYLFRFESYETIRADDVVPRLVPVPTSGIGRARAGAWIPSLHPGDPCLVVTAVEPGSLAARGGLREGDLVVQMNGSPCGDGLFVRGVAAPAAEAGVKALERIVALNGIAIGGSFDWSSLPPAADGRPDRLSLAGREAPVACPRDAIRAAGALHLLQEPAVAELRLLCLRGGEPVTLEVPAGQRAGVSCETTAYPLICAEPNRIAAGAALEVDPGSYLVVARHQGHETLRHRSSCSVSSARRPAWSSSPRARRRRGSSTCRRAVPVRRRPQRLPGRAGDDRRAPGS